MFEITRLTVEHLAAGCVTDCSTPRIGFSLSSDRQGAQLADAELTVGDWSAHVTSGQSAAYVGPALLPFTTYSVRLNATDDAGETATATTAFETGRMETPWKGRWISDPSYHFTEAKVSPVPMVFRKEITTNKPIARARLYATAMGIYEAELNGQKLGEQYFAPGFTSYKSYLQYQTYDVTALLTGVDTLTFTVAGGGQLCVYPQKPRDCRPSSSAGRAAHRVHGRHDGDHRHRRYMAGQRERPRADGRSV